MRLQFWIDYILAARQEFLNRGECRKAQTPMLCALDACFRKMDKAIADARDEGFEYCVCVDRSRGERLALRFRQREKRIERTIAHPSAFTDENGAILGHEDYFAVKIAIGNSNVLGGNNEARSA